MIEDNLEGWDFAPEPDQNDSLEGWDFAPEPTNTEATKIVEEPDNIIAKEEKLAVDYLTKPKSEQTEAFKQGQESITKQVAPTEVPKLESQWFGAGEYTLDSINSFMGYHMSQGKTKQEALKELQKAGANGADLRNAVRYGTSTPAPSQFASDVGVKNGLARTGTIVAQASVDIASALGVDTTEKQKALDFARGEIQATANRVKEMTGINSPVVQTLKYAPEALSMFAIPNVAKLADTGSLINVASKGWIGKGVAIGATEGALEYTLSRGDGYSVGQSMTRGFIAGSLAGGLTRLVEGPTTYVGKDGLTDEARDLLRFAGVEKSSKEYIALANEARQVELDDQARILAERLGDRTGSVTRALQEADDQTRMQYAKILANETKEVVEALGFDKIDDTVAAASKQYGAMKEVISKLAVKNSYNLEHLVPELSKLESLVDSTPAQDAVKRLAKRIQDNPVQNVSDLIDIKEAANRLYKKSSDTKAKMMLKTIKDDVDNALKKELGGDSKQYKLINDTIETYHIAKSQKELADLFEKAKVIRNRGSEFGEIYTVDWGKLLQSVKDAGYPKVVEREVELMENIAKKYGSFQADAFKKTVASGVKESVVDNIIAQSVEGLARTTFTRRLVDTLWANGFTDSAKAIRVQRAIRESMEKGKTYKEFAKNIVDNSDLPTKIRASTQNLMEEFSDLFDAEDLTPRATKVGGFEDTIVTEPKAKQLIKEDKDIKSTIRMGDSFDKSLDRELRSETRDIAGKRKLFFSDDNPTKVRNINIPEAPEAKGMVDSFLSAGIKPKQGKLKLEDGIETYGELAKEADEVFGPSVEELAKEADDVFPVVKSSASVNKYNLPDDIAYDENLEALLDTASVAPSYRKGPREVVAQSGGYKKPDNTDGFTPQVTMETGAIETQLSKEAAKRIRAGKATPEDLSTLREELRILNGDEAEAAFPSAEDQLVSFLKAGIYNKGK